MMSASHLGLFSTKFMQPPFLFGQNLSNPAPLSLQTSFMDGSYPTVNGQRQILAWRTSRVENSWMIRPSSSICGVCFGRSCVEPVAIPYQEKQRKIFPSANVSSGVPCTREDSVQHQTKCLMEYIKSFIQDFFGTPAVSWTELRPESHQIKSSSMIDFDAVQTHYTQYVL